ncbi:MAG TPA: hypothetical protein VFG51_00555 [Candidatus Saccharimonadia bacterium]|nr:hypothetical protein [Candidatus Saccharimonadia bacterium]
MLTLFHGDNLVASRKVYVDAVAAAKAGGLVVQLVAKTLTPVSLGDTLGAQDLFCQKKTVAIEGLLSLLRSKAKDQMIELVLSSNQDILLWEGKSATPAQLKKFPNAKIQFFRTSPAVFVWLDSMRPGNAFQSVQLFRKAVEQEGAEMCFAMLTRQVRLLLQAKEGSQLKMAPFAIAKLKKQAEQFSIPQLMKLHKELVRLDGLAKTSGSAATLEQNLTLLLLSLGGN